MEWSESYAPPIPKWKVGLWVWRVDGAWRLRLYRPWNSRKLIETQSNEFLTALYVLGVGADWWKANNAQKDN